MRPADGLVTSVSSPPTVNAAVACRGLKKGTTLTPPSSPLPTDT
jgi:hypothetical protein